MASETPKPSQAESSPSLPASEAQEQATAVAGRIHGVMSTPYGPGQLRRWQEGARRYRDVVSNGLPRLVPSPALRIETVKNAYGELQALLLGEKPAMFHNLLSKMSPGSLVSAGLAHAGEYVYDREQVRRVMHENNEFTAFGTQDPDELMRLMAAADLRDFPLQRGLLLGYPRAAAEQYVFVERLRIGSVLPRLMDILQPDSEDFHFLLDSYFRDHADRPEEVRERVAALLSERADALGILPPDVPYLLEELAYTQRARRIDVHGAGWVEYGKSEESAALQRKMRDAFAFSGILDEDAPNQ